MTKINVGLRVWERWIPMGSSSANHMWKPQTAFERLDGVCSAFNAPEHGEYGLVVRGGTMISYVIIERAQYRSVLLRIAM